MGCEEVCGWNACLRRGSRTDFLSRRKKQSGGDCLGVESAHTHQILTAMSSISLALPDVVALRPSKTRRTPGVARVGSPCPQNLAYEPTAEAAPPQPTKLGTSRSRGSRSRLCEGMRNSGIPATSACNLRRARRASPRYTVRRGLYGLRMRSCCPMGDAWREPQSPVGLDRVRLCENRKYRGSIALLVPPG